MPESYTPREFINKINEGNNGQVFDPYGTEALRARMRVKKLEAGDPIAQAELEQQRQVERQRLEQLEREKLELEQNHKALELQKIRDLIRDMTAFEVTDHLDEYRYLNHTEIAEELINAERGFALAEKLDKFQGLDHNAIAQKLITTHQGWALAKKLDKFQGLDHNAIAQQLIAHGYGLYVAENLAKFQGISPYITTQLREKYPEIFA